MEHGGTEAGGRRRPRRGLSQAVPPDEGHRRDEAAPAGTAGDQERCDAHTRIAMGRMGRTTLSIGKRHGLSPRAGSHRTDSKRCDAVGVTATALITMLTLPTTQLPSIYRM